MAHQMFSSVQFYMSIVKSCAGIMRPLVDLRSSGRGCWSWHTEKCAQSVLIITVNDVVIRPQLAVLELRW